MMHDVTVISDKRAIVLIHGSWLGGWSWREVAGQLTAQGYRVLAPTLTGLGDRSHLLNGEINLSVHIEDVVNHTLFEGLTSAVLVGHSYGAMVAVGAADRLFGRVACEIVLVDGFLTEPGEAVADRYPDVYSLMRHFASPDPSLIEPPPVETFGLTDPDTCAAVAPFLTRMPLATHTEKLNYDLEKHTHMSRTYICCKQFPMFHQTASAAAARGWHSLTVDAGHLAPITHPRQVADLITASMAL